MSQLTYFLIDDDTDDHEIFSIASEDVDKSIKCCTALDGHDALCFLNANESFIPDMIFLDLNMPRMSGKECLGEIKKIPRLVHVPIVIYSTSAELQEIQETQSLGADYFLKKPSTVGALSQQLRHLYDQQKDSTVTHEN